MPMRFRYDLLVLMMAILMASSCGKTPDEPNQSDKDKVIAVESLSLSETSVILVVGSSLTLSATVRPENATYKSVSWRSSDEAVVSVKAGEITACSEGSAIIHANAADGKSAVCNVEVKTSTNDAFKEGGEGQWE